MKPSDNQIVATLVISALAFMVWIVWQADPETIERLSNGSEFMHDGTLVYLVEIDGHQYLKTDKELVHSASCNNPTHNPQ